MWLGVSLLLPRTTGAVQAALSCKTARGVEKIGAVTDVVLL